MRASVRLLPAGLHPGLASRSSFFPGRLVLSALGTPTQHPSPTPIPSPMTRPPRPPHPPTAPPPLPAPSLPHLAPPAPPLLAPLPPSPHPPPPQALALGADAVSIGVAALIALGDNSPAFGPAYRPSVPRRGSTTTGRTGATPWGSPRRTTRSPRASTPSSAVAGWRTTCAPWSSRPRPCARACGKSHVQNLEPEDLVALTVEAAAMARVPLAGTTWIPGTADG